MCSSVMTKNNFEDLVILLHLMDSPCQREQLTSHYLIPILTKQTHIIQGLSVINGIWRTSPSFSHFATEPEVKKKI